MTDRRFRDRPKRLARRAEREKFDRMVMPAAFICVPLAVAILLAAGLSYVIYGLFPREIFGLGMAVLVIPLILLVFRFMRGHFSSSLHEP
jgi:ABC-type xylose transport system permease subunit